MLLTLLKKEFLEHLLSLRFVVAFMLSMVLITLSLAVLRADYIQEKDAYDFRREAYRQEAEEYGSFLELETRGIRVDRPPAKLQLSYEGLEKSTDRTSHVMAFLVPAPYGELFKSPVSELFPTPDMLYVVAMVLSLMAFIFSYDAVSGERESGTMRLVLSYSVPRDRFILAKWLGGYSCLLTPLVMGMAVAAVVILLSGEIGFTASDWIGYVVAAAASCLFIAVMFSIGVFVSSRCTRSATAIVILLLIWVGMVLFMPNMSPYISNQVSPVTPSGVIENDMRQKIGDFMQEFNDNIEREYRRLAERMRQDGPEGESAQQEFQERLNTMWDEFKHNTNVVAEQSLKGFRRELDGQIDVAKMISRLSPVSSYVYIATDVAGTGLRRHEHFMDALEEYQAAFRSYIDQKTQGLASWKLDESQIDYDISDMPVFKYVEEPVRDRIAGSALDFTLLGIEVLFFFVAAFVSFVRADVL